MSAIAQIRLINANPPSTICFPFYRTDDLLYDLNAYLSHTFSKSTFTCFAFEFENDPHHVQPFVHVFRQAELEWGRKHKVKQESMVSESEKDTSARSDPKIEEEKPQLPPPIVEEDEPETDDDGDVDAVTEKTPLIPKEKESPKKTSAFPESSFHDQRPEPPLEKKDDEKKPPMEISDNFLHFQIRLFTDEEFEELMDAQNINVFRLRGSQEITQKQYKMMGIWSVKYVQQLDWGVSVVFIEADQGLLMCLNVLTNEITSELPTNFKLREDITSSWIEKQVPKKKPEKPFTIHPKKFKKMTTSSCSFWITEIQSHHYLMLKDSLQSSSDEKQPPNSVRGRMIEQLLQVPMPFIPTMVGFFLFQIESESFRTEYWLSIYPTLVFVVRVKQDQSKEVYAVILLRQVKVNHQCKPENSFGNGILVDNIPLFAFDVHDHLYFHGVQVKSQAERLCTCNTEEFKKVEFMLQADVIHIIRYDQAGHGIQVGSFPFTPNNILKETFLRAIEQQEKEKTTSNQ